MSGNVPRPTSLRRHDVRRWVEARFEGRLILLPRAEVALEGSRYRDSGAIFDALELLGDGYVRMMQRRPDDDEPYAAFNGRLVELGLRLARAISETERGAYRRHYEVKLGKHRRVLDWQLRSGGNTTSAERSLRIYFLYDSDRGRVVVGWLPSHLPNRLSP